MGLVKQPLFACDWHETSKGIRVLDNYCWQVIAPFQTRLFSDNVPIKTTVEKGGRSGMVMRKNDNYKSIVGCVTINVLK